MPMKLRVVRPFRNGNMMYDAGDIIEPPAAIGDHYKARGICVPANEYECKPRTSEGLETAKAPDPEKPTKRTRPSKPVQPPESKQVKHDDVKRPTK